MTPSIAFAFFLVSGACGLLYQVVWTRLAFTQFGVLTPVLSIVVASFMLGLGAGSLAAGPLARVWSERTRLTALWLYAAAELGIALGAFAVPAAFRAAHQILLQGGDLDSTGYLLHSAVGIALSLLPFCFCMGLTFPLAMAALGERSDAAPTSFSLLYLANVVGAMAGALVTSGVLIELFGFRHTLGLAAATNLALAAAGMLLASRAPRTADSPSTHARARRADRVAVPAGARWTLITLFSTAFVAMALEIVWTRAMTPILGTTIYTFAAIVAVYLLATWLGTWAYRRSLTDAIPISYEWICGALTLSTFVPVLVNDPRVPAGALGVLTSIGPLCALLGYLTPRLVDEYSGGSPVRAGFAYTVNVVGSIAGPLAASYVLLPRFGTKTSMIVLSGPVFALFLARARSASRRQLVWVTSACVLAASFTLGVARSRDEKCIAEAGGIEVRRDYTATVASCGDGMLKRMFVNGVGITRLTPITKAMAHVPIVSHRGPVESALMICFGMGTTYRSLLSWSVHTVAVELVPSVRDAFGFYHRDASEVLADPNGRVVIDDGRRYLERVATQYDLITLDPPPPVEAAGSSMLYSTEFYDLVKQRLAPNGILQQWWPDGELKILQAVARSVSSSFPYVRVFKGDGTVGFHFLASLAPIEVPSVTDFIDRLPERARADIREWSPNGDLEAGVGSMIARELPLQAVLSDEPGLMITDDRPFNEYYFLRRLRDRRDGTFVQVY